MHHSLNPSFSFFFVCTRFSIPSFFAHLCSLTLRFDSSLTHRHRLVENKASCIFKFQTDGVVPMFISNSSRSHLRFKTTEKKLSSFLPVRRLFTSSPTRTNIAVHIDQHNPDHGLFVVLDTVNSTHDIVLHGSRLSAVHFCVEVGRNMHLGSRLVLWGPQ